MTSQPTHKTTFLSFFYISLIFHFVSKGKNFLNITLSKIASLCNLVAIYFIVSFLDLKLLSVVL